MKLVDQSWVERAIDAASSKVFQATLLRTPDEGYGDNLRGEAVNAIFADEPLISWHVEDSGGQANLGLWEAELGLFTFGVLGDKSYGWPAVPTGTFTPLTRLVSGALVLNQGSLQFDARGLSVFKVQLKLTNRDTSSRTVSVRTEVHGSAIYPLIGGKP